MQKIDGNYLYLVGSQIHPISEFKVWGDHPTTYQDALYPLVQAETALDTLLHRSVFKLKTSIQAGEKLLSGIRQMIETVHSETNKNAALSPMNVIELTTRLTSFEAVLGAELGMIPLYVVTQKAGFDTATLIESGALCFPVTLFTRVDEAINDLENATRCLAFELPTAAGFHLHRANESVLHRYWDAVSGAAPRPKTRNMGDYLKQMDDKGIGDPKVKAALKDLKDLHRNPLIHPEDSLTLSEAIALMNGIYTVMVHMLKAIPEDPVLVARYSGDSTPATLPRS